MRTRYSNRLGLNLCYSVNTSLTIFIHFFDDVKIDSYHCLDESNIKSMAKDIPNEFPYQFHIFLLRNKIEKIIQYH